MTDSLTPKYQFMVTDLLTNRILGQLPIEGASYTRAIRAAGSFSGTIKDPNMLAQSDIYHNTMPGRTGLYVLRNNVCVWGGIIWSREYDANEKSLSINGSEFTSYFHHRKLWRTFSTQVGGTLTVPTSGDSSVQLELGSAYNFKEGQSVYLAFTDASLSNLNGYFSILANPGPSFFYIDPAEKFYRLKSRKITKYDTANAVDASSATVEFKTATNHTFRKGDTITIKGSGNARMNGTRTIKSVPNSTTFTAQINAWANFRKEKNKTVSLAKAAYAALDGSIPPGTYSVTLDISVSTYDYVRKLIEAMALDFDGSVFPNSAIESGVNNVLDVETIACQEGYAILRTSTAHELSVGQKIVVRNVRGDLNGDFNVSNIIDDVTFEYFVGVNSFSETDISLKEYSLTKKRVINKTVTYTTDEAHTLTAGDYVTISGVPNETENYKIGKNNASIVHKYDGSYRVQVIPTTTTFQIDTNIVFKNSTTPIDKNLSGSGRVYSYPEVIVKTYGPFKENSDIGITFNDDDENLDITKIPASVRGFELVSLGEYLDTFTDSTGGFDYRIDCEYDAGINEFKRIFRVIPIDPPYEGLIDSTTKLQLLGADKVVFEYPGNISSVTMSESAENAANRFFLVGNKESLSGGEASQPYSAATFNGFSTTDFPLLDASASDDQSGDEDILYEGAYRYANESRPPLSDISININGSLLPAVGDYSPGDWCTIIINDPFIALRLASDTEERDDLLLRKINSFSVSINEGSTFPESVTLELVTEFGVDVGELS